MAREPMNEPATETVSKIELVWPGKGRLPVATEAGRWSLEQRPQQTPIKPLDFRERFGSGEMPGLVVMGDRIAALSTLRKTVSRSCKLLYVDVPRIEGFDESRAFQSQSDSVWSTWLSVLREHLVAAKRLLRQDGVVVCQAGDPETPFVRLVMEEVLGHANYLGTAVWRTHYSPKGGKPTRYIAPIHEALISFAIDAEQINPIAIRMAPKGYALPDDDPRGDWKAPQKDAGRDTVKLTYNAPPYRWSHVGGDLPPGLWRVSPFSGVIWGTPTKAGSYTIEVRVEDSAGKTGNGSVTFEVSEQGEGAGLAPDAWWRTSAPKASKGGHASSAPRKWSKAVLGLR